MRNSANTPHTPGADLFGMVDHCEVLCAELVECRDSTLHLALCGRLSHSLDVLRYQLDQPLTPHLIERLTADHLPVASVSFVPDSDLLCQYCLALVQALLSCALTPDTTQQLSGLLYELVGVLADDLKAPRFIREVRQ